MSRAKFASRHVIMFHVYLIINTRQNQSLFNTASLPPRAHRRGSPHALAVIRLNPYGGFSLLKTHWACSRYRPLKISAAGHGRMQHPAPVSWALRVEIFHVVHQAVLIPLYPVTSDISVSLLPSAVEPYY